MLRHMARRAGTIVMLAAFAITGCSLGRKTTPLEQYVLGEAATASNPASAELAGLVIGVRRLDLAPYLATPAIAVRHDSRIVHSEYHRWGDDPREGINRAVARYLAAVPVRAVDVAPWPAAARHDFVVQLHVSRFEGVAVGAGAGEAQLSSTWEIFRDRDGVVLARGTTDYRAPGWRVGDYAGLVALLDGGLRTLAAELASCMTGLAGTAASVASAQPPPVATCATSVSQAP